MFEQAVLPAHPPSRRFWGLAIGVTGEALLIASALVAPIIWHQLLPRPNLSTWLTLAATPPSPAKPSPPVHVRPGIRAWQPGKLVGPSAIPDKVAIIFEDDPPVPPRDVGGITAGDLGLLATGLLNQAVQLAPPPRPPEPRIAQPAKPATAELPPRYKVGGVVHMARLVQRVDPIYPDLARHARISGTVELTGVIGIDGHIRELQVVRGQPLLARAALDAVSRWVYEPTLLNGEAVEVIAPITVNFLLN